MSLHRYSPVVITGLLVIGSVMPLQMHVEPGQGVGGTPATGKGVIAGRVVDGSNGEPVIGAEITLRAAGTALSQRTMETTRQGGNFEFLTVAAGWFLLSVTAEGYLVGQSGQSRSWDPGMMFELRAGEHLTGLVLKLWRVGTISGTVRDETGEPVVGAVVYPLRSEYQAGERLWALGRSARSKPVRTDDRGTYRLTGLQPADYIIVVPTAESELTSAHSRGPSYQTGFSGGATSARAAQVISLGSGDDRSGVDVQVRYAGATGFSVSGRIVGPDAVAASLKVRLTPPDAIGVLASFEELTTTTGHEGTFTFPAVPAGSYRLQAWRFPEASAGAVQLDRNRAFSFSAAVRSGQTGLSPELPGPTWVADIPVNVVRAVHDLVIQLQPAPRITGRVIFDGDGARPTREDLLKMPIVPIPAFDRTLGTLPGSRIEADGRFATVGLPPGPYVLRLAPELQYSGIQHGASFWYVSSLARNGRVLVGTPVVLQASDVDIDLTLTDRTARITGTVQDSGNAVWPDLRVIAFARDAEMRGYGVSTPQCVHQVPVDRFGRFAATLLPSCEYFLAAVVDPPRDWMAPEYLESLVGFATPISLEFGQTRTISLAVHR